MNAMFKEIRHGDIEKVKERIAKNSAVVNEVFNGTKPKKDIGQSPLQVAIKCGAFEIINVLLENGADVNFMEDPALVPPHSTCMPVIHDAIIGAIDSLLYRYYEDSEKYVELIERMLEKGADPNKEIFCENSPVFVPPVGTLVTHAKENLSRYADTDATAFEISKKRLFEILDLLKKYGADFDKWLDYGEWGGESSRAAFLDDFVPQEDVPYEMKYHGRVIKGISKGDIDRNKEIRAALREYFKIYPSECTE